MDNESLAAAFKALGDPTRLRIYQAIKDKDDICACKILEQMDITQPTLSHHVKQLCAAGLVSCRKDGRWMHYSANNETAALLSDWISGLAVTPVTPEIDPDNPKNRDPNLTPWIFVNF